MPARSARSSRSRSSATRRMDPMRPTRRRTRLDTSFPASISFEPSFDTNDTKDTKDGQDARCDRSRHLGPRPPDDARRAVLPAAWRLLRQTRELLLLLPTRDVDPVEYHSHASDGVVSTVSSPSRPSPVTAASDRASGDRRWGWGPTAK